MEKIRILFNQSSQKTSYILINPSMHLLITGIHGFVGSNLVEYLSQGKSNTIYGLDIVAPEKPGVAKTFSWEDLDAGRVPEVDAIIHLAGKAHDTKNKSAADWVKGLLIGDIIPFPASPYGENTIKTENYIISRFTPEKHLSILLAPSLRCENVRFSVNGLRAKKIASGINNIGDGQASLHQLICITCNVLMKKTHIRKINCGLMTGKACCSFKQTI